MVLARRSTSISARSAAGSLRWAGMVTFFSFLGLPRRLAIDQAQLERRFRDLSRQFHPDYFYNASPTERLASLERSSYLNDAYRALRNPISRIEHLLAIEGLPSGQVRRRHGEGAARAAGGSVRAERAIGRDPRVA